MPPDSVSAGVRNARHGAATSAAIPLDNGGDSGHPPPFLHLESLAASWAEGRPMSVSGYLVNHPEVTR